MTQQNSFLGRRNVRRAALVAMVGMTAGLGGCISQADYDRVLVENRTLTNRNQELRASLDECEAARSALGGTRQTGDQTISQLTAQLNEKDALLDDYESRMRQLEQQMQGLSFDSAQGMLRFNSDLTFGSGSDVVSAGAKQTLNSLASILKGSAASQYDLVIVGHTDSQRIGATTAQKHPTNMHLSCHRAISVRRELASLGISESKIQAAGWGDQRPLVPNTANGNTPANRRVEIYLGRSVGGAGGGSPAGGSGSAGVGLDRETPPDRQPAITK